jgi:nicotinamide-nucleotide amidase
VSDIERASEVIAHLVRRGETLATAESMTGGLIGYRLTSVPGASQVYRGGVISYATDLKADLAGVSPETLARQGPVAGQTVGEMAAGIARRCRARWGLATTGVAGPDPQDGHAVGEVYVALADGASGEVAIRALQLSGTRSQIRSETAERALRLLRERLREGS